MERSNHSAPPKLTHIHTYSLTGGQNDRYEASVGPRTHNRGALTRGVGGRVLPVRERGRVDLKPPPCGIITSKPPPYANPPPTNFFGANVNGITGPIINDPHWGWRIYGESYAAEREKSDRGSV